MIKPRRSYIWLTHSHTLQNYYVCVVLKFRTQLMHCEKVSHTAVCWNIINSIWDLKLIETDLFIVCFVCCNCCYKYAELIFKKQTSYFLWLTVKKKNTSKCISLFRPAVLELNTSHLLIVINTLCFFFFSQCNNFL